jgi:hypothetical protein
MRVTLYRAKSKEKANFIGRMGEFIEENSNKIILKVKEK